MPKRKKLFPCGHKGYGQKCHRCAQKQTQQAEKRQQQEAWRLTFDQDAIDLRSFPKNVVLKARQILDGLARQEDYRQYHGKRLRYDRQVISIPVTRNYRLLCRDRDGEVIPERMVSHEDYNRCKPGE
ncbi:MAG: hypothetical protein F6J87_00450 [Spirulina sp. SIO3F2]|nr:hypothetical protein [Spirulina sp. SIO3F2]